MIADKKLKDPKVSQLKSLAEARANGYKIDTLKNVAYNGITFVPSTGSMETKINSSSAGKKVNDFVGPIKGENGVYFYQVIAINKNSEAKYDEKEMTSNVRTQLLRNIQTFGSDLYLKGNVKDKRYLFF